MGVSMYYLTFDHSLIALPNDDAQRIERWIIEERQCLKDLSVQVISRIELLKFAKKGDAASKTTEATAEHIMQKVLDILQISLIELESAGQQLRSIWTEFYTSNACPQPTAARLGRLLHV